MGDGERTSIAAVAHRQPIHVTDNDVVVGDKINVVGSGVHHHAGNEVPLPRLTTRCHAIRELAPVQLARGNQIETRGVARFYRKVGVLLTRRRERKGDARGEELEEVSRLFSFWVGLLP